MSLRKAAILQINAEKVAVLRKKEKKATNIQTKAVATKAKAAAKTKNEEDELTEFHSDGGKQLKKADTQLGISKVNSQLRISQRFERKSHRQGHY